VLPECAFKYGRQYFADLRKRRKSYPKYNKEEPAPGPRISPRVVAAKMNGRRGGLARAARYSAEERSEWARRGGKATQERYSNDFYRAIRKLRKEYRKGYQTQRTKERQRKSVSAGAKIDRITPRPRRDAAEEK